MDQEKFDKYLKGRYQDQINWYSNRSTFNKRLYTGFQWALIVMSAVVPVLTVTLYDELIYITATIAAVVAICTTALKTFKFQENWLNYRTVSETLKKEKYLYEAGLSGYCDTSDKEALFVERVESLISRENVLWLGTHTHKEKRDLHKTLVERKY